MVADGADLRTRDSCHYVVEETRVSRYLHRSMEKIVCKKVI